MTSPYLSFLPAIYRDNPMLSQFLALFDTHLQDLEKKIDEIPAYFSAGQTPEEFLDWLAGWVALALRQDWPETKQRRLIREMSAIYPIRGTKAGLEQLLGIYVGPEPTDPPTPPDPTDPKILIQEQLAAFQIGVHSTVGVDTLLGGAVPHHFTVIIDFPTWKNEFLAIHQKAITDIVDLEKPAHTYYTLDVRIPTFQVGVRSTVGQDTVLGNKTA